MVTELTETGPNLSEKMLAQFEQKIGFTLPKNYREFLLTYNGGKPSPCFHLVPNWHYQQSLVAEFKSLEPDSVYVDLSEAIELLEDRLPRGFIPIAGDPGGNYILISLDKANRGNIYFWDHENEPEDYLESLDDYANIYWLANDFEVFLNNLKKENELETSDLSSS